MSIYNRYIDENFYENILSHRDDKLFAEKIRIHLKPEYTILDAGAGAGNISDLNFKHFTRKICGLNPAPCAKNQSYLPEAHAITRAQYRAYIPYILAAKQFEAHH